MDTQGYGQFIHEQIKTWPIGKPVTTAAISTSLADAFKIGIDNAKKITNVNMKRLADKGELTRVQRGVYGVVKDTSFGKVIPRLVNMLPAILLHDGVNFIGYLAGPTLLNRLGLSTLIPADSHIATNRYRYRLPENTSIRIYKPLLTVNDENVLYLQALEAIIAMERYHVDVEKPDGVMRAVLQKNNIDNEKLVLYARRYCGQKTLLKTIDIALGGSRDQTT